MPRFFCECCDYELGPDTLVVIGNHTICDADECQITAKWYIAKVENNPMIVIKPTMADVHIDTYK